MAETAHSTVEAEAHGERSSGGTDPLHHIKDYTVCAIARDGRVISGAEAYDSHGSPAAGYQPAMLGPFKLEFTRVMQDVTVVAVLLTLVTILVAKRVVASVKADQAPKGRLANLVESLLCFVRDEIVIPIGGHHLAHYTPLFLTYFFFILVGNLVGMIPWLFKGPTANIAVTAALGGSVFVILTLLGLYNQGPVKYFLHLVPPGTPWWLWPLMFVLEFTGPLIKSFVLCIRLFANMIAGHLVVSNVLGLGVFKTGATGMAVMGLAVGMPLALGVNFLEIMVCFIQAYVFTMLSVIFVGAAVHPEH
jgi:F-type H+-transporting ATPase subunit a